MIPAELVTQFLIIYFRRTNTSTAFAPTSVPVLARWARIFLMMQSMIALLIIALLAERAINIL